MIIPDIIQNFNIGTWSIQTINTTQDNWFDIENFLGENKHAVQINFYYNDKLYWIELSNEALI